MDKRSISIGLPAALLLTLLLCLPHSDIINVRAESTDPAVDQRPHAAGAQALGLVVTATVGIEPDECAVARRIRVYPGTRVYYCYRATNTGQTPLTVHSIRDTQSDVIWDRQTFELLPGASMNTVDAGLELDARIDAATTTTVTWSARAVTATLSTSATSAATVFVVQADAVVVKGAGVVGEPCEFGPDSAVPEDGNAGFCVLVENTGGVPLVQHRLTDPFLELDATFAYTLAPSERLTITQDSLSQLGVSGSLVVEEITRTIANTIYYTGTSASDAAATGPTSVSDSATVTVSVASPRALFTATVGTDPNTCAQAKNLSLSNANTEFYYCVTVHNTGNVPLTEHAVSQRARSLLSEFPLDVNPGEIVEVTNAVLEQAGQPRAFGPVTVRDRANLQLSNIFVYTGTTSLLTGVEDETRACTVTFSSSTFAGVASTPSPTPTATNTPRSSSSQPTNTPRPQATATWTPVSPLPTPAPQVPTFTPTPTRSYQISLLETPTPQGQSPLVIAADLVATQEAEATLAVLNATSTAAALSPLATPTETPTTFLPPTDTPTPSDSGATLAAETIAISVTATPTIPPTQRPVILPPPAPTPDALLFAAQTVDAMAMTAVWIWFLFGTLVFFVVAGVLVGLSFRQNEQQRFDLVDAGLVEEYEFLLPPPQEDLPYGSTDDDADRRPDARP